MAAGRQSPPSQLARGQLARGQPARDRLAMTESWPPAGQDGHWTGDISAEQTETQSSGARLREPALAAPLSGTPWNQKDQGSSAWSARTRPDCVRVRRPAR